MTDVFFSVLNSIFAFIFLHIHRHQVENLEIWIQYFLAQRPTPLTISCGLCLSFHFLHKYDLYLQLAYNQPS